jgi:hypothetical protein
MAEVKARASMDPSGFQKGIGAMDKSVSGFAGRVNGLAGGIQAVFAGIAGGMIVRGIKSIIDFGSEMLDTAESIGITVEELQAFEKAARLAGASSDTIKNALNRLADAQGAVINDPECSVAKSFAKLGITAREVASADLPGLMRRVAEAYSSASDKASAFNAIGDLFGTRVASRMRSALGLIATDFDGLSKGIQLTTSQAQELDAVADGLAEVGNAAKVYLGGGLVKVFDGLRFWIRIIKAEIGELGGGLKGFFKLWATSGGNPLIMAGRAVFGKNAKPIAEQMTKEIAERGKTPDVEKARGLEQAARIQTLNESYARLEEERKKKADRGVSGGYKGDSFTNIGGNMGGTGQGVMVSLAQQQIAINERMLEIEKGQADILREISRNTGGGSDE